MFTGIVQAVGHIVAIDPKGDGLRLGVDATALDTSDIALGDSVALDGCCLTVVGRDGVRLAFDVSAETIACTVGLDGRGPVNLEKALRFGDRLGGHLVAGHVDGVGVVRAMQPVADADGSVTLEVEVPPSLARFVAPKGSIAVQGVSLTVNVVDGVRFEVNLIPHTLAVTTLGRLVPGARVNLEADLIARYLARLVDARLVTSGT
jgi:riboflavin synthase